MAYGLLGGLGYYTIDVVCAAAALIFALAGAKKGAIRSVIGLCSTLFSLIAAYSLAVPVAALLDKWFAAYSRGGEFLWTAIAGIAVFVVAKILLSLIAAGLTKIANSIKAVGAVNTLLGAAVGFLKAVILICAVLAVISVLPETAEFSVKAQTAIDGTFFTHVIRDHNPLLSWLEKIIESAKARAGM